MLRVSFSFQVHKSMMDWWTFLLEWEIALGIGCCIFRMEKCQCWLMSCRKTICCIRFWPKNTWKRSIDAWRLFTQPSNCVLNNLERSLFYSKINYWHKNRLSDWIRESKDSPLLKFLSITSIFESSHNKKQRFNLLHNNKDIYPDCIYICVLLFGPPSTKRSHSNCKNVNPKRIPFRKHNKKLWRIVRHHLHFPIRMVHIPLCVCLILHRIYFAPTPYSTFRFHCLSLFSFGFAFSCAEMHETKRAFFTSSHNHKRSEFKQSESFTGRTWEKSGVCKSCHSWLCSDLFSFCLSNAIATV